MPERFDLDVFLPYRLNRAAELVGARFAAGYKARYALTRSEWRVLALLGAHEGMTATEIGRHAGMNKTNVSRAVHALELRRWLKRLPDAGDRRLEHLALTPEGRAVVRELVAVARAEEAELRRLVGQTSLRALEEGLAALEAEIRRAPEAAAQPASA